MFDNIAHEGSWILAAIGAINWGYLELTGTDLVTGTLGLDPGTAGIVFLLIGLAGLVSLYHYYEMEVMD